MMAGCEEELVAVPAIALDVALVHMNRGDAGGNGQYLGVDRGRRPHQQRVGLRHGCEQLVSVGAIDPADFYLVAEGGDGRFG